MLRKIAAAYMKQPVMNSRLLIILLCLLSTAAFAQTQKIVFDHYGLSEGFNSREAMDIVTAKNGMVWISSNDGLVRFDSKRFKFYQHIPGDSNSIKNNYCKALSIDSRGWIWVCSGDNLDVFNPVTEKFTHLILNTGKKEQKPVKPTALYYDAAKDIMWIGCPNGLYYSKAGSTALQSVSSISSESALFNAGISAITAAGKDELWLTAAFVIYKLNTNTGVVQKTAIPFKIDGIENDKNIGVVTTVFFDNKQVLWLGTWLRGLIEFNTVTKEFHQYVYSDYKKEENTVKKILQTQLPGQENTLCLSTYGWGFTTFCSDTKKFTSYSTPFLADKYGIKGNTHGMYLDSGKNVWIGSAFGLQQYNFSKQLFHTIDLSSIAGGIDLLPVDEIAIEKNNRGRDEKLWLGIPYKGGYVYDLLKQQLLNPPKKIARYLNPPTGVFCFFIDSKNNLWVSTNQYGLMGYDIAKDELLNNEKQYFFEPWKWVNNFFEDAQHRLWLATFDGLFVMDSTRKNIREIVAVNSTLQKNNLSPAIRGITGDKQGNIWVTADYSDKKNASIVKYSTATDKVAIVFNEATYTLIKDLKTDLRDIYVSDDGKVYAHDFGGGLTSFHINDSIPQLTYLNTAQGLPSNYIGQFIPDTAGNIWCSSNFGISYFKKNSNVFTNYSYDVYALGSNDLPVIYLSPVSGIMYVGESNAINYFYTRLVNNSKNTSPLIFTEFKIFNQVYHPQNNPFINGGTWQLNYDENTISVEFALLSYTNPRENMYSWMLQGYEQHWNTGKNNIATYANIKPGTYTLFVKAVNSSGEWSDTIQLTIQIKAPFYKTWWFLVMLIIILTGLVYYLLQLRIKRLKEKYELRNKIATDLHDEIGSTITSINILSNVSQQAMEKAPEQAKEMMEQIAAQSKQIQQNMSDIVWSIRPDNEKMENLLIRMKEYTAQTLEPLQIKTIFNHNGQFTDTSLALQYRKEVLLIFKEAINNIAKHANATEVNIEIHQTKNRISLSITDNGQWKNNGNSTGTGTRSMQQRAAVIGGSLTIEKKENGTVILLNIPIT